MYLSSTQARAVLCFFLEILLLLQSRGSQLGLILVLDVSVHIFNSDSGRGGHVPLRETTAEHP